MRGRDDEQFIFELLLKAVLYWHSCGNATLGHYCQVPDTSQSEGKAVTYVRMKSGVSL